MKLTTSLRVGFFLAVRQIKRANIWTSILIVSVMMLTFLNLIVVGGILVGIVDGVTKEKRETHTGDLIITDLDSRNSIRDTATVENILNNDDSVLTYTVRNIVGGIIEANYRTKKLNDTPNKLSVGIVGIDPIKENETTGIKNKIALGEYLLEGDAQGVLVGWNLVEGLGQTPDNTVKLLKNIEIGSKVQIEAGNNKKEYIVRGIIKSKIDEVSRKVYMDKSELRKLSGAPDLNADEIAIKLKDPSQAENLRTTLLTAGIGEGAKIQTSKEAEPKFVSDVRTTFEMLGNIIGGIGLVVASITLFIVIFINAVTRRKYIGILKGIGISSVSIEFSYILQALFYAILGSGLGLMVIYALLKPFFDAHPIDFPFSDVRMVAHLGETLIKAGVLVAITTVAGYIPAKMIIRKNTLDSILGRN